MKKTSEQFNAVANLETDISSDAAIELPSSESAPAPPQFGLRKFRIMTKKATFNEREAVVMRVDFGMSSNGVKLTASKEMAQREVEPCSQSNRI